MNKNTEDIAEQIDSLNNRIISVENELDHIVPGIETCPDNVRGELVSIISKLERERDDLLAQKHVIEDL